MSDGATQNGRLADLLGSVDRLSKENGHIDSPRDVEEKTPPEEEDRGLHSGFSVQEPLVLVWRCRILRGKRA